MHCTAFLSQLFSNQPHRRLGSKREKVTTIAAKKKTIP
jgi:hypothetical protein